MKRALSLICCLSLVWVAACSSSSKKGFSESVDETIENNQDEFDKCYKSAVKQKRDSDPNPAGRIEVGFTVNPAGRVTESNILTTDVNDTKLEKCVQETLRRVQFPKNDEGRIIQTTYPFNFGKR
jgi:hypothetical protein